MIKELHLENFRGFATHRIELRPTTIIVGRNNAGKSTIVEALRLISLVTSRYKSLRYSDVPSWLDIPIYRRGVTPSLKNTEINLRGIFHRYGDPPAKITAIFSSGEKIVIYVGNEELHAVIFRSNGKAITTKGEATGLFLPRVSILPQIAPLAKEERKLDEDYVVSSISSSLASLHFRNQLYWSGDLFDDFRHNAEATWNKLRLKNIDLVKEDINTTKLYLWVQDGDFEAEIGWMGHGLQMWLQTIWFLTRSKGDSTVILDEPDVYMHADLQRKLIRSIREQYPQVIIATHSSEIMAEVEPDDILVINRNRKNSIFATSFPAAQKVLTGMGSVHNLQLARLWTSRRFLMVEGKDISLLKRFQNKLFPKSELPIDIIPSMPVGGWGGWSYAVGSSMLLENAVGEGITIYCILDSDYHTAEEISTRLEEAKQRDVQLHIWAKKEIENYLLIPAAICRLIKKQPSYNKVEISEEIVTTKLNEIAEQLYEETFDGLSTYLQHIERKIEAGTANKRARKKIDPIWKTLEGKLSIISGKKACSLLSEWSNSKYNVSFSTVKIAHEINKSEINDEVKDILTSIETNELLVNDA